MTDTVRTLDSLLTSLFQDGQAPGSITAQDLRDAILSLSQVAPLPNTQTANYVLALSDAIVHMNSASGVTVTVPPNSSVAFVIGTTIEIVPIGAGQVTLVAGGGVILHTPSSLTSRARWSSLAVRKIATDEWIVAGDMT